MAGFDPAHDENTEIVTPSISIAQRFSPSSDGPKPETRNPKPALVTRLTRRGFMSLVAAGAAYALAACGGSSNKSNTTSQAAPSGTAGTAGATSTAAAAKGRSGGNLRFGQSADDLGTLDPHFASATQDRSLVDMVYNALIRYKPGDSAGFEPELATALPEPQMLNGAQVWSFSLRKGVMVHPSDGVPAYELTSDDVVYSLQKASDKTRSAYSSNYTGLKAEAVDPSTVKITLDKPVSTVLFYPIVANYSGGYIIPRKPAEKLGPDGLKTHPVGTGPYIFKSYSPKDKTQLIANDAYFRGKPQLDTIDFRYMADLSSRELGVRNKELDVVNGTQDQAWVDKMAGVANVKVDIFGVGEAAVVFFNQKVAPLDKLEVRQAIAYALSRDEFQALVGAKVGEKVYAPIPQFLPGGMTADEVTAKGLDYKTDQNKAKQMLAGAGFPNSFSLDMTTSELPSYRVIYESMQAQLAKVGIKINLKTVDHTSYHAIIRKDANPLVVYVAFRPNADVYLRSFYRSDAIVVTGAHADTNFAHYTAIDALIDQARAESDPAKQIAMWKEADVKILQDMAGYPIYFTNQIYARSTGVDYGHPLKSVLALYPGIDETTRLSKA
ncbi:MAG: ABC transporter substrate-binding protein [Dehalococcoidia bacterium]